MQLTITGQHLDLTDALKSYVTEKLGRVDHYFDHVIDGHVVLKYTAHEKLPNAAEVTVHAPGRTFHAESEDQDMYAAIDLLAAKLEVQVRNHKEKLTDRRNHHQAPLAAAAETD
ncbi:ribosome hibernation-promoting factor, HPF/YfiA family [Acidithiobacillus sp.]